MQDIDESSAPSFTSCNLGINWAVFSSGDLFREERVSKFNQALGRIYFLSFFKATGKMCLPIMASTGLFLKNF